MWKGMKECGKSPTECNTIKAKPACRYSLWIFICMCVCAPVQIKYFLKHVPLLKENLKWAKKDLYDTHPLKFLVIMAVKKYSRFKVTANSSKNKLTVTKWQLQPLFSIKIRKKVLYVCVCCILGLLMWVQIHALEVFSLICMQEVYGRFMCLPFYIFSYIFADVCQSLGAHKGHPLTGTFCVGAAWLISSYI